MRWIFNHLLWDPGQATKPGPWTALWALRKVLLIVAGTVLLTWREWVEHHPPDMLIITVMHLVFVFAVVALFVAIARWIGRGHRRPAGH